MATKKKIVKTVAVELPKTRAQLGKEIESRNRNAGKWCDEMGFDCVSHAIDEYGLGDDIAAAKMVERDIEDWANRQQRRNRDWDHNPWNDDISFDDRDDYF